MRALIIGWFVNGYLNRRNEIAKKRLEFVLPTLKAFTKVWYKYQLPSEKQELDYKIEMEALITEVREYFYLYGTDVECALFEKLLKNLQAEGGDYTVANQSLTHLRNIIRIRIRKELNIK